MSMLALQGAIELGLIYALVALGLTTWDVPAFVSALVSSVFLLWLLVFMRRQLLAEVHKLFTA